MEIVQLVCWTHFLKEITGSLRAGSLSYLWSLFSAPALSPHITAQHSAQNMVGTQNVSLQAYFTKKTTQIKRTFCFVYFLNLQAVLKPCCGEHLHFMQDMYRASVESLWSARCPTLSVQQTHQGPSYISVFVSC